MITFPFFTDADHDTVLASPAQTEGFYIIVTLRHPQNQRRLASFQEMCADLSKGKEGHRRFGLVQPTAH